MVSIARTLKRWGGLVYHPQLNNTLAHSGPEQLHLLMLGIRTRVWVKSRSSSCRAGVTLSRSNPYRHKTTRIPT